MQCKSCALISERGRWEPPSYQNAHRDEWLFLASIARSQNPGLPRDLEGYEFIVTIEPNGWLSVKAVPPTPTSTMERVHDLCMDKDTISALRAVEARYGE